MELDSTDKQQVAHCFQRGVIVNAVTEKGAEDNKLSVFYVCSPSNMAMINLSHVQTKPQTLGMLLSQSSGVEGRGSRKIYVLSMVSEHYH